MLKKSADKEGLNGLIVLSEIIYAFSLLALPPACCCDRSRPSRAGPCPVETELNSHTSHEVWNQKRATRNALTRCPSVALAKPSVTLYSAWKKMLDVMLYRPMAVVLVPDLASS